AHDLVTDAGPVIALDAQHGDVAGRSEPRFLGRLDMFGIGDGSEKDLTQLGIVTPRTRENELEVYTGVGQSLQDGGRGAGPVGNVTRPDLHLVHAKWHGRGSH